MTMRIVIHKNDMSGPIKMPTISISEGELTSAEKIYEGIDPSLSPLIVNPNDLPDRWFQHAWIISDGRVLVDMEIARELHIKRMRISRASKFSELDIQFQRALETGADTAEIVAKKQRLRDVTIDPRINAAKTTQELRSVWPKDLLGEPY